MNYNLHWIINVTVCSELALYILITKEAFLRRQLIPVCSKQSSIEWYWW